MNPRQENSISKEHLNRGKQVLIPRQVLFSNPKKAYARVSPDGTHIAFLAPLNEVLNIWIAPVNNLDAVKAVTEDKHRGIRSFSWAHTSQHILYSTDKDGDENFHVYVVNINNSEVKDLTPMENIAARVQGISDKFPDEVLIAINNRDPCLHDLYRVNIVSGQIDLLQENPGFAGFINDDDFSVRFAVGYSEEADQLIVAPDGEKGWKPYLTISSLDALATRIAGFNHTGDKLYLIDSRNRNTAALKVIDLNTGDENLIAENEHADIGEILLHPKTKEIDAVSFTYTEQQWQFIHDEIAEDFSYLAGISGGEIRITSRSSDDKLWTVAYTKDDGPIQIYLYDRRERKAQFLFCSDDRLASQPLAKMHSVIIESRDKLKMVSYLTLPVQSDSNYDGKPDTALPMVLLVHGGPWGRDSWGYNAMHQLLANRGYAVLSVNFRGSTGFGKHFINAADGEWGAKMHDDLLDAVDWAVNNKIADKDKIAIMGGSYGGYAALIGLTKTPDVFACAVDFVGPSNLVTLLENPPPYWMPVMSVMKQRVGDWTCDEGRKFLESRSPLFMADKIRRPLLIGHGKHDPRVKQSESEQMVEAMNARNIPVTYVLFSEEGHGFVRPENRIAFNAIAEQFLARCLGGHCEPINDDLRHANFSIPSGGQYLPTLEKTSVNKV